MGRKVERVVAVTLTLTGFNIMELISRAKIMLYTSFLMRISIMLSVMKRSRDTSNMQKNRGWLKSNDDDNLMATVTTKKDTDVCMNTEH